MRSATLTACLVLALSACSSGDFGEGGTPLVEGFRVVRAAFHKGAAAGPAQGGGANMPQGLTRAALAGVEGPLLLAQIEKTGAAATLKLARTNQGYQTFASPDKLTMTFKGGVLSASRGLAGDLLGGETDATLSALHARRAATYSKALRYIGGDRQIILSRLTCRMDVAGPEKIDVLEVSHETTHMAEVCTDSGGGQLRNDYWIGAGQVIWKSRQFLHPIMGYVTVQQLLP